MSKRESRLADLERWSSVVPEAVTAGSRAQATNVLADAIADIQVLRSALAAETLLRRQREAEAMDAAMLEARSMKAWRDITTEAKAFAEFVRRHTWPERAEAHGFKTVFDVIAHHPFSKEHLPKQEQSK